MCRAAHPSVASGGNSKDLFDGYILVNVFAFVEEHKSIADTKDLREALRGRDIGRFFEIVRSFMQREYGIAKNSDGTRG